MTPEQKSRLKIILYILTVTDIIAWILLAIGLYYR